MIPLARAKAILLMVRNGETPEMFRELAHRMYSDEASYVLRRDLTVSLTPRPVAKIPFSIRPLQASDLAHVVVERPRRLPVLRADIPTC